MCCGYDGNGSEPSEFMLYGGYVNNVEVCFGMYFVSVVVPDGASYKVTAANCWNADSDWVNI
jgi:hypothetical protein